MGKIQKKKNNYNEITCERNRVDILPFGKIFACYMFIHS